MVRTVQIDDSVQAYADQKILKRAEAEVGILVGRNAGGKDFLLQLVQSPDQDGELPIQVANGDNSASKKGGAGAKTKAAGKLVLDEDWIIEHAAQAARAMPGGLDILGIYVLCDDKTYQGGHGVLINVLKGINDEISHLAGGNASTAAPLLALHIDAITGKIASRELSGTVLKPCEVKGSPLLANMAVVQCQLPIELKINLAGGAQKLEHAIREAISWHSEHFIAPAVPLVNGASASLQQQVADVVKNNDSLSVELLTPVSDAATAAAAIGAPAQSSATGKGQYQRLAEFSLNGAIDCRAYVHKRESLAAAIAAVKADVERSLLARLDILVEAAEMAETAAKAQHAAVAERDAKSGKGNPQSQPPRHPLLMKTQQVDVYLPTLPRRSFLKWSQGGCSYCDYIVEDEGVSEAVARVQELMGTESVDSGSFSCEERIAVGSGTGKSKSRGSSGGFECNAVTAGAAIVAVVAVWLSWTVMS